MDASQSSSGYLASTQQNSNFLVWNVKGPMLCWTSTLSTVLNVFSSNWHNVLKAKVFMLATVTAHIQYTVKAYPLSVSDYEPQSICEHLQYLFALLQNSNRKYIDPSGLVKALGLDTGQQQVHSVPFIWSPAKWPHNVFWDNLKLFVAHAFVSVQSLYLNILKECLLSH